MGVVAGALVVSAVGTFELVATARATAALLASPPLAATARSLGILPWLTDAARALDGVAATAPSLLYLADWLAFAQLALAVLFFMAVREPVRHAWVLTFGMGVSLAVLPLALVAGAVRGIPLAWRLVDCAIGLAAFLLLWLAQRALRELVALSGPMRVGGRT